MTPDLLHFPDGDGGKVAVIAVAFDEGGGDGDGHDRVVGELALRREQFEIFGFDVVEFVPRSDDIAQNCADHGPAPPHFLISAIILRQPAA